MKRILFSIVLILFVFQLIGQQTNQYKYHIFDDYLLNPAYVGYHDYYSVLVGHDQRFSGLSHASPQTTFASIHSKVGKGFVFNKNGKVNEFFSKFGNIAFGFQFANYTYGPQFETNIGLTYGYTVHLKANSLTQNLRSLTFAVTPRLQNMGYNFDFTDNDVTLTGDDTEYNPYASEDLIDRAWFFTSDVAALYRTVAADAGISLLNIVPYKNRLESETLILNDSTTTNTYDLLYSGKVMANVKFKKINVFNEKFFSMRFVPKVAALYFIKPKTSEFYVDMMLDNSFTKHYRGHTFEKYLTIQVGFSINHMRHYQPTTLIQPYLVIDFKNYAITYSSNMMLDSDIKQMGMGKAGNQISILFKIGQELKERRIENEDIWSTRR